MGRFSLFLVRQLRRRKFPVSPEAGTRPKFLEGSCGTSPSVPRWPGTAAPGSRAVLGEGRAARCPARGPQPWCSEVPPVRRHQPGSGGRESEGSLLCSGAAPRNRESHEEGAAAPFS